MEKKIHAKESTQYFRPRGKEDGQEMPPRMSILHSATRQLRRRGRHQHKHQPLNRLRQTNAGNLAFISVVSAHKRRASDGFTRRPLSGRSFAGTPTSPWLPLSAARSPSASDLGFSPSRKSAHAHALTEVFVCCRIKSSLHFSHHIYPFDPFKKVFLLKFTFVLQSAEDSLTKSYKRKTMKYTPATSNSTTKRHQNILSEMRILTPLSLPQYFFPLALNNFHFLWLFIFLFLSYLV